MAKQPDELAVPGQQLTQPPKPPPALTVWACRNGRVKCERHGNEMASARMDFRAQRGPTGVGVIGNVHLRFTGCKCNYWRPLK